MIIGAIDVVDKILIRREGKNHTRDIRKMNTYNVQSNLLVSEFDGTERVLS